MNHNRCDIYRQNWDLFKGLLALYVLLFKLFLLWIQICLLIH